MKALTVENLDVNYEKNCVLWDLTFSLPAGSFAEWPARMAPEKARF